jgi:hypothetical protein
MTKAIMAFRAITETVDSESSASLPQATILTSIFKFYRHLKRFIAE